MPRDPKGSSRAIHRAAIIPFETSRDFRARVLSHGGLISDEWDPHADHIGFFRNDVLMVTFRMVRPVDGRLPISEHAADLPVADEDRQIGRFAALGLDHWNFRSAMIFYDQWRETIATQGRVYVAVPAAGPAVISIRRYATLHFEDTGRRYYDDRYAREFCILRRLNAPAAERAATAPHTARAAASHRAAADDTTLDRSADRAQTLREP